MLVEAVEEVDELITLVAGNVMLEVLGTETTCIVDVEGAASTVEVKEVIAFVIGLSRSEDEV